MPYEVGAVVRQLGGIATKSCCSGSARILHKDEETAPPPQTAHRSRVISTVVVSSNKALWSFKVMPAKHETCTPARKHNNKGSLCLQSMTRAPQQEVTTTRAAYACKA
eukprot:1154657-Pelagomonas_calceolata.AAC.1